MPENSPLTVIVVPALEKGVFLQRKRLPITVMGMATCLVDQGVSDAVVLDGQALDLTPQELAKAALDLKPDCVGFSLVPQTLHAGIETAAYLKEARPGIVTIAGGKHISLFPEQALGSGQIDFVVRGEGEETLPKLINACRENRFRVTDTQQALLGATGIASPLQPYTDLAPRYNLRTARPINWGLLEPGLDTYRDTKEPASEESSRFCIGDCSYCIASNFHRGITFKPVGVFLTEKRHLIEHGFNHFFLIDDDALFHPRHASELIDAISQSNLPPFDLELNTRTDSLMRFVENNQALARLAGLGNILIHTGLESAHPTIQKYNGKRVELEKIEEALERTARTKISLEVNFLIGLPPDTTETITASLEYAEKLQKLAMNVGCAMLMHVAVFLPYPGTRAYNDAVKSGILHPETLDLSLLNPHGKATIGTRTLSSTDVDKFYEEFYRQFYTAKYLDYLSKLNSFTYSCIPMVSPAKPLF